MVVKCTSINPEILKWARESAGYTLEDICVTIKKYNDWENGTDFPTYTELEKIASKYKRPLAIFFFPEAPKEISQKKSFRTIPEYEFDNLPPTIKFLFRKGLSMQENLKELNNNKNTEYTTFTKSLGNITDFSAKNIEKIRKLLDVSFDIQFKTSNRDEMFEIWRNAFANIGIYVFKEAFKDNNVGGFCLYDEMYPIIFVNNSTTKNRQIFTLFHELAHLLLRGNHIDLSDRNYVDNLPNNTKRIEIICNKFAGNFLVPDSLLNTIVKNSTVSERYIEQLSDKFSVSQEVIARKLLDKNIITQSLYKNISEQMKEIATKHSNNKGGNYYYNQITYLGKRYLGLIIDKYNARIITFDQAVQYAGIKASKFYNLEHYYSKLVYGGAL